MSLRYWQNARKVCDISQETVYKYRRKADWNCLEDEDRRRRCCRCVKLMMTLGTMDGKTTSADQPSVTVIQVGLLEFCGLFVSMPAFNLISYSLLLFFNITFVIITVRRIVINIIRSSCVLLVFYSSIRLFR